MLEFASPQTFPTEAQVPCAFDVKAGRFDTFGRHDQHWGLPPSLFDICRATIRIGINASEELRCQRLLAKQSDSGAEAGVSGEFWFTLLPNICVRCSSMKTNTLSLKFCRSRPDFLAWGRARRRYCDTKKHTYEAFILSPYTSPTTSTHHSFISISCRIASVGGEPDDEAMNTAHRRHSMLWSGRGKGATSSGNPASAYNRGPL